MLKKVFCQTDIEGGTLLHYAVKASSVGLNLKFNNRYCIDSKKYSLIHNSANVWISISYCEKSMNLLRYFWN